jgi:hypothetical protein
MADFDQAGRYLIRRGPEGFFAWQWGGLWSRLSPYG